jgi:hypothetical protein
MSFVATFLTAFAVLTSSTHAATPPVAIQASPSNPVEGLPVSLTASTEGRGVSYSWDLDGDGTFGDAEGATVTHTLSAGARTVSVRATDASGIASTETRSIEAAKNVAPAVGMNMTTVMDLDRSYQFGAQAYEAHGSVKLDFDLDGDGTFEVANLARRSSWGPGMWAANTSVAFDTVGEHLVRVRATDELGATAVATTTVHVRESAPSASLSVFSGSHDHAAVAGQPATVSAYSARTGATYEFDLDGDGTYELDKGPTSEFQTTLDAGTHVLGVRITDTRGGMVEQRITTFVYQPADAFGDKVFPYSYENTASVGEPADLSVWIAPYTFVYTIEWDADGDGDFDDGTFTTPGGDSPFSSTGRNTYTYAAPGVYDQRVRVSRAGLPTRIFSWKTYVSAQPVDRTPSYLSFGPSGITYGERSSLGLTTLSRFGAPAVSFDLDGDGAFDEVPTLSYPNVYSWAFTAPVTASIKATDPVSGKSVVGTMQVQPATPTMSAPDVTIGTGWAYLIHPRWREDVYGGARPFQCCSTAWDADGDGAYDDGTGESVVFPTTLGEHTVGLRVTDSANHSAFVRKTFTLAAPSEDPELPAPPLPGPPSPDPVLPSPQPPKTLPLDLKPGFATAKLGTLLKRGLAVKPGCAVACRATVVIAVDKATAKRLKLRSAELGRTSGKGSTITVKLNAKARNALRKTRSVKVTVAILATAADGRVGTSNKTLTVKREA